MEDRQVAHGHRVSLQVTEVPAHGPDVGDAEGRHTLAVSAGGDPADAPEECRHRRVVAGCGITRLEVDAVDGGDPATDRRQGHAVSGGVHQVQHDGLGRGRKGGEAVEAAPAVEVTPPTRVGLAGGLLDGLREVGGGPGDELLEIELGTARDNRRWCIGLGSQKCLHSGSAKRRSQGRGPGVGIAARVLDLRGLVAGRRGAWARSKAWSPKTGGHRTSVGRCSTAGKVPLSGAINYLAAVDAAVHRPTVGDPRVTPSPYARWVPG